MKRFVLACAALAALALTSGASAAGWSLSVPFTNQVADNVIVGGGYPVPPGQAFPNPGTCRLGVYNANRSESWIAVKPGTEDLVGTSKIFFEKYSTFYDFHLGSHTFHNGVYSGSAMVTGYDCVSTGTQDMPPSWMNNTDPNVDFDTKGRAYQVTLPFNPFWANLHPNGAIDVSYSDDLGRTWTKANGGDDLENSPRQTAKALGHVEDKQWVAVNHIPGNRYQDHVYAAWALYEGNNNAKIRMAVSRDRGASFDKAVTVTAPSETGPLNEFVYPAVDAAGNVYMSIVSSGVIYVSRSTDDAETWGPWMRVAPVGLLLACCLPNTMFRDGIAEHFVASQTYANHLYLTFEDWDGSQFDVKFVQSTDGGMTWTLPEVVNDNADRAASDQFQPSVAQGPGGGVAVAFYDRRQACPADAAVIPSHVGRTNFCIDTSLQAYRDSGGGAAPVGPNVRISEFTWDPEQPEQTIDGLDQMACASHENPCVRRSFIGDYFGLAMSATNVYALMVSTHYPSKVKGDGGGPVYYQQQVLATVARPALGN